MGSIKNIERGYEVEASMIEFAKNNTKKTKRIGEPFVKVHKK